MNDTLSDKQKQTKFLGIHDDESQKAFEAWNKNQAVSLAKEMGIELAGDHWKVIDFLRVHYQNTGQVRHARELTEALNERFAEEGGSRWLYLMFPGGPVNQACRIAGVPAPDDATDESFGSTA